MESLWDSPPSGARGGQCQSLGERESATLRAIETRRHLQLRTAGHPLLWGEGRGEGEQGSPYFHGVRRSEPLCFQTPSYSLAPFSRPLLPTSYHIPASP